MKEDKATYASAQVINLKANSMQQLWINQPAVAETKGDKATYASAQIINLKANSMQQLWINQPAVAESKGDKATNASAWLLISNPILIFYCCPGSVCQALLRPKGTKLLTHQPRLLISKPK